MNSSNAQQAPRRRTLKCAFSRMSSMNDHSYHFGACLLHLAEPDASDVASRPRPPSKPISTWLISCQHAPGCNACHAHDNGLRVWRTVGVTIAVNLTSQLRARHKTGMRQGTGTNRYRPPPGGRHQRSRRGPGPGAYLGRLRPLNPRRPPARQPPAGRRTGHGAPRGCGKRLARSAAAGAQRELRVSQVHTRG
jgi:hypothetical protein